MNKQNDTDKKYAEYLSSKKWRDKATQRLSIDNYTCTMCGSRGTTLNPLEVHHWGYQEQFGQEDVWKSLCTLCHECHKQVHFMMMRKTAPDGTNSRIKNPSVPRISIYTITGKEILSRLEYLDKTYTTS